MRRPGRTRGMSGRAASGTDPAGVAVVTVSWAARWMVAAAARLLPATIRPVKTEEFSSELYYLARSGSPRRRQVAYALRILGSVVPLRWVVAGPRVREVLREVSLTVVFVIIGVNWADQAHRRSDKRE